MLNAQETITAAIEKLEGLRDAACQGPWERREDYGLTGLVSGEGESIAIDFFIPDADLIVTLHRTIDAQLALLKELLHIAETAGWSEEEFPSKPGHEHGLLLARSILGEASSSDVRRDYAPGRVNGAVVGALVGAIVLASIALGLVGAAVWVGLIWVISPW
ncbi:hypothetical protein IT072_13915 [Leifsonia sp. ZF2019]|uniref:hypothetical protein n=1 Tax=Leifsonia sp. ZF2019 TaxID=2781978 RepID=UPI001CBBE348|nr:hypothetical protein [Leifsonia sp. ZF2019]UAJ78354.1 hypothetical protein IT072_13915 [Leifsonia sp. ZF2019]